MSEQENEKVAVDLSTRCRHSGLLAYEIASAIAAAEERGRRAGIEEAGIVVQAMADDADLLAEHRLAHAEAADAIRALIHEKGGSR